MFPLLDEFRQRFSDIRIAYIILDKGYDNEEIYQIIYESYDIIPVIIRKKVAYPKGFTKDGCPLCLLGYPMKRAGIDYDLERTKYLCEKIYENDPQRRFDFCPHYGF